MRRIVCRNDEAKRAEQQNRGTARKQVWNVSEQILP